MGCSEKFLGFFEKREVYVYRRMDIDKYNTAKIKAVKKLCKPLKPQKYKFYESNTRNVF